MYQIQGKALEDRKIQGQTFSSSLFKSAGNPSTSKLKVLGGRMGQSKRCVVFGSGLSLEAINSGTFIKRQGFYRSWKTWKVMKFRSFIFQALKVIEINC